VVLPILARGSLNTLRVESAVLDGEIACIDDAGRLCVPRSAVPPSTVRVHRV
jgi:hypothetical protein